MLVLCLMPNLEQVECSPTFFLGPILDDRLQEEFLKPWKGVLCFHFHVCLSVFACVSVRSRATQYIFWLRNLFGLNDHWDMRKKRIFFVFRNIRFFPYITLVIVSFKLPVTVFHIWMWYLSWENIVPLEIEDFWMFLKIHFFTIKGVIFPFFVVANCQNKFGDSWDIHGMRPIILGNFFPTIMMEIRTFQLRKIKGPRGQFFKVNL